MLKIITRDLPSNYFTSNKFCKDGATLIKFLLATDRRGNEIFVIWGPSLNHVLHREKFEYFGFEKAISAGYIKYDDDLKQWLCWGESTSLRIRAREIEDTTILNNWIMQGCV